jgi:hypothetical protein
MGRQKFEELMRTHSDPLSVLKKLDVTAGEVLQEALQQAKKDVA